jgi:hypothetical protein
MTSKKSNGNTYKSNCSNNCKSNNGSQKDGKKVTFF